MKNTGLMMAFSIIGLLAIALIVGNKAFSLNQTGSDPVADSNYLFNVTHPRLTYEGEQNSYSITGTFADGFLLTISPKNTENPTKTFPVNIESEFNILSVSPDEKFMALFEHRQNYGGSVLHVLDLTNGKELTSVQQSIADVHWFQGDLFYSQLEEGCAVNTDQCADKNYLTSLYKLNLTNFSKEKVLDYTETTDDMTIIEVVEVRNNQYIISLRELLQENAYAFKKVDLEGRTVASVTPDSLAVTSVLHKENPFVYRVEVKELPSVTQYIVTSTLDANFNQVLNFEK